MNLKTFKDLAIGDKFRYGLGTRIYTKINDGQAEWTRKNGQQTTIGINPKHRVKHLFYLTTKP